MPVLALTAHAMADDERKCREAGCSGYLTKPIDPQDLLEAIAKALRSQPSKPPTSVSETDDQALVSKLPTDDPDFREIVNEFVAQLASNLAALRAAWARKDMPRIAEIAHWVKGAGGTAGFDVLTAPAAILERAAKDGQPDFMMQQIERLETLLRRAQLPLSDARISKT
jgi:HPt (histidine-containing phosphotransfer) domain-containing protein